MSEVTPETEGVRGFVRIRNSVPRRRPFMRCVLSLSVS